MSIPPPPRCSSHRLPKRQRFHPVPEDDEEDEDEDYSAASLADEEEDEEDDEDSSDTSVDDEPMGGEDEEVDVEVADDVGVTRMATIGKGPGDTVTEAQSRRSVSSSPSSSSSHPSIKLKISDILDCPTCCEPLKRPIYQCINGHLACSLCCTKLRKRCPFCRQHIGDIRCRAMEKVIEASIVPCRNAIYGCKETTSYGSQSTHEKFCVYVRCYCPLPDCNYTGSYTDLESHARCVHSRDTENLIPFVFDSPQIFSINMAKKKTAVFQEEKEGNLVVVQAFKGSHGGVYMTVSYIAPMTPGLRNLSCSLAKLNACTTLRLGLMVKKIQKARAEEEPKDDYMFIPSYMLSGDHLKMQICIGSGYKYVRI